MRKGGICNLNLFLGPVRDLEGKVLFVLLRIVLTGFFVLKILLFDFYRGYKTIDKTMLFFMFVICILIFYCFKFI